MPDADAASYAATEQPTVAAAAAEFQSKTIRFDSTILCTQIEKLAARNRRNKGPEWRPAALPL